MDTRTTRIAAWANWELHRRIELTGGLFLIMLDKVIKIVAGFGTGIGLLFISHNPVVHRLINTWDGKLDTAALQNVIAYILGKIFDQFLSLKPSGIVFVACGAILFGLFECIEFGGLLKHRRWAEYLVFVATVMFVPPELISIEIKITLLRVITCVINVAIVIYLVWRKRLFWDKRVVEVPATR